MTERDLQKRGMLYLLDEDLRVSHEKALQLTYLLNNTAGNEREKRKALVQELFFEVGDGSYIEPPFFCDYGCNIIVGKNFPKGLACSRHGVGAVLTQSHPMSISFGGDGYFRG